MFYYYFLKQYLFIDLTIKLGKMLSQYNIKYTIWNIHNSNTIYDTRNRLSSYYNTVYVCWGYSTSVVEEASSQFTSMRESLASWVNF